MTPERIAELRKYINAASRTRIFDIDMMIGVAKQSLDALESAQAQIAQAKDAAGDFCKRPFDGSLRTAILAISMRCGASERRLQELEPQLSEARRVVPDLTEAASQFFADVRAEKRWQHAKEQITGEATTP